jgi:tRNA (guanine37-N1)-methyltransferase
MKIDIITLFPDIFTPLFHSIPGRVQQAGLAEVRLHNLRQWGKGKHQQVDDNPYGGGPGMVMACPPLFAAFESLPRAHTIYLTPQGQPLTQARVNQLAQMPALILLCGHYEGIDERVIEHWVDEEISIGDFVVSGGELPAMLLADAILRVLPGALREGSAEQDSFYNGLLDYPHYTRPLEFAGRRVPEVLLSGHHAQVEVWRAQASRQRTQIRRPDLYERWLADEEARSLVGNSQGQKIKELGKVKPSQAPSRLKGDSHGQEVHPCGDGNPEEAED